MIFPKSFKDKCTQEGIILVDVLLALSVSALFVLLTTELVYGARELFESAKARLALIEVYERHVAEFEDLDVDEVRRIDDDETGAAVVGRKVMYGNERTETVIDVHSTSTRGTPQTLTFVSVKKIEGEIQTGNSLCSVNFTSSDTVGSYNYISRQERQSPEEAVNNLKIIEINLPIPITLPLTDMVVRNNLVYLSADSSAFAEPDILVVDIADPDNVLLKSSIHTGPGVSAIAVDENKIFGSAASTASQLHTVRIDSPEQLSLESRYQLVLPYATATPAIGSAIFADHDRVYLGTEKWAGAEFVILDVSGGSPSEIATLEIGSKVNKIYVAHGRVFIASAGQGQLVTADLGGPVIADSFSPSGWQRQEGKTISYFEKQLSFGRTSGGFNIVQDHELFRLGSTPVSRDSPGGVYGIVSDRNFEFAVSRRLGKELQMYDKNLSAATSQEISLPGEPLAMVCDGDSLYVLARSSPTLYKISFTPQ
jgi:hypothetical protein